MRTPVARSQRPAHRPMTTTSGSAPEVAEDAGMYCSSSRAGSGPLRASHVVAEQEILVTQVEPAAGDDGVGPGGFSAAVRLLEAALLDIPGGGRLGQCDGTSLAADVEVSIGADEGAFTHAPIGPGDLARLPVQAGEVGPIEALEVVAHEHH